MVNISKDIKLGNNIMKNTHWKKLVKESVDDLNENVRQWVYDLYKDALEETEAAIENERIWQNGADSDDEIEMHESNLEDLEEYYEFLQERLDELN